MIIIMRKGKIHCILSHKDKKTPMAEVQAEEAAYYVKAIAGAACRFTGKAARSAFIDKICNEAKNEIRSPKRDK